jgi:hypothetical protein
VRFTHVARYSAQSKREDEWSKAFQFSWAKSNKSTLLSPQYCPHSSPTSICSPTVIKVTGVHSNSENLNFSRAALLSLLWHAANKLPSPMNLCILHLQCQSDNTLITHDGRGLSETSDKTQSTLSKNNLSCAWKDSQLFNKMMNVDEWLICQVHCKGTGMSVA